MKPSPRDSAATRKLLNLIADKATGRLQVGGGASAVDVYVLHGEVVAAVAADDDRHVLRLLTLRGELDPPAVAALEQMVDAGEPLFGKLLEIGLPHFEEILSQRFRQNLCDYVASHAKPTFAPQKGVFVDNIQMGHETRPLVEACCAFATKAQRIHEDVLLVRGSAAPRTAMGTQVAGLLTAEPQSVYSLVLRIPLEPTAARCLLVDLVVEGVAAVPGAEPAPPPAPEPVAPAAEPDVGADERPSEPPNDGPHDDGAHDDEPHDDPAHDDPAHDDAAHDDPAQDDPAQDDPAQDDGAQDDGAHDDEPLDEDDRDPESVESLPSRAPLPSDLDDEPGDDENDRDADSDEGVVDRLEMGGDPSAAGDGPPSSLAAWMSSAAAIDEDELDFFSDNDFDRGGDEEGSFSTDSHNLDKVEVAMDDSELLEAEEAPVQAKGAAPMLTEEDADHKIDVADDVIRKVVAALDEAEGSGRGQAVVQLLVDGSPPKYSLLLSNLVIDETGRLPAQRILANLYSRPASEHRQLLHSGMLDLIERALGMAAEELPDEAFEQLFDDVAGYKQRLGF